jgi:hypothetical protein
MSFVQWVTALALLVVTLGGVYGGVTAMVRRRVEVPPYTVEGRGAILLALLYWAGALVAFLAFLLIVLNPSA